MRRPLLPALLFGLILTSPAPAQTWTGVTATEDWNTPGNWNPTTVPNSATAAVTFPDVTNSAFAFVVLQTSVQAQSLTFTNTANTALNYNITSSGSPVLSGVTNITVGSAVTTTDTINLNAVSTGSLVYPSGGSLTITNNAALGSSPTLVIGPSTVIGTPGTGGITVAGTGYTRITGSFAGTGNQTISALNKNGSGQLDLNLSGDGSFVSMNINAGAAAVGGHTVNVTGSSFDLNVGSSSTSASLIISNGAVVNSPSTAFNSGVTIDGPAGTSVTVTGAGSQLNSGSFVVVSQSATGSLIVQNGGAVTLASETLQIGTNPGSAGTLLVQTGGKLSAPFERFGAFAGSSGTGTVTGSGSSMTATVRLDIGTDGISPTGIGQLTIANGGAATSAGATIIGNSASTLTINGGTLTTGSLSVLAGAPQTVRISDSSSAPALTIGTDNSSSTATLSLSDASAGPGTVNKVGAGTFTLTGVLTNTGGFMATQGTIDFSGAVVQPGPGSLTAAAGATIQYDTGARVFGGFLRGPGTHVVTAGTTFNGTTAMADAAISETGAGTFVNFTNGGSLSIASGLTTPTVFNGFSNEGSGSITIGAGSKANAAAFQSYGLLTLDPGSSSSAPTEITNTGTTPLYFNGGSRTFIGTPATASSNVAGIDLHGQNAVVAGGLFVNNGFVATSTGTASVIADFGSLVKGAGFFQNPVITQNGGKFQAGNSPGAASFGSFVMGPGGVSNYVFAIDDATGTAGPSPDANGHVSGWGLVKAVKQSAGPVTTPGDFTWTATPADMLTFAIDTLVNPTTVGTDIAGPMADFSPTQSYSWPALHWTGNYAGPTDAAALDAATTFDTSGIVNATAGSFGWSLDTADQTLSLTYSPIAVPEPGALALSGIAAIGWVTFWRRRWRRKASSASQHVRDLSEMWLQTDEKP